MPDSCLNWMEILVLEGSCLDRLHCISDVQIQECDCLKAKLTCNISHCSIFRLTGDGESFTQYHSMVARLNVLLACSSGVYNETKLQELCDTVKEHPTWATAHVASSVGLFECFRHPEILGYGVFTILFISAPEPKAQVHYCDHALSVVRPSSVRPSLTFHIFDFSSEIAEQNSTKLDRKQDLNLLFQVCVFRADRKNKMAALASDWLRHFRLLL